MGLYAGKAAQLFFKRNIALKFLLRFSRRLKEAFPQLLYVILFRLRQSQAEDKPPDYSQLEFSAIEVESNDSSTHTSCGSVPPPSYEDVANAN